jgi:hypothetical protein
MTPEQSHALLENLLAQIEDPEALRQIILLTSAVVRRLNEEVQQRDAKLQEQDQIIATLLDFNEELAVDANRYTLLKYTVPHMLTVMAYSAQFTKDLYKSIEVTITPDLLEETLDIRIEQGDLDELLDQLDAAAEAEYDLKVAEEAAEAEVLTEAVQQEQLAALASRVNEADTAYSIEDEGCADLECPFCYPSYHC